jgi:hypothetical protein
MPFHQSSSKAGSNFIELLIVIAWRRLGGDAMRCNRDYYELDAKP